MDMPQCVLKLIFESAGDENPYQKYEYDELFMNKRYYFHPKYWENNCPKEYKRLIVVANSKGFKSVPKVYWENGIQINVTKNKPSNMLSCMKILNKRQYHRISVIPLTRDRPAGHQNKTAVRSGSCNYIHYRNVLDALRIAEGWGRE